MIKKLNGISTKNTPPTHTLFKKTVKSDFGRIPHVSKGKVILINGYTDSFRIADETGTVHEFSKQMFLNKKNFRS